MDLYEVSQRLKFGEEDHESIAPIREQFDLNMRFNCSPSSTTVDQDAPSPKIEAMQEIFMNFKSGGWDFVSPPDKAFGHLSIGSKGLQISQSPRGIFINQSKYALESLKKYGYESCDPVDTPMVEKSKLDEEPSLGYGIVVYLT
ncbi:hypothetical protein Tco_1213640 [Tanacetum coccineum]